MRKRLLPIFVACLLFCGIVVPAGAQSYCSTTMELSVSTGYNPLTGGKLDAGAVQELWMVTYVSPTAAALYPGMPALPYPAYIPASIPWSLSESHSNWISYLPEGVCTTTGKEDKDSFFVTYTRTFHTCIKDSFLVSLNLAADNYCSGIRIDGKAVPLHAPFAQVAEYNESNFKNWTSVPEFMLRLSSGMHTMSVDIHNFIPEDTGTNPTGLNIEGKLFSLSSRYSLVNAHEGPDCRCSCLAPIKVHVFPKDTLACMSDSLTLWATGGDQYKWLAADNSWQDSTESPRVPVQSAYMTYTVLGIDGPCSARDTFVLRGKKLPDLRLEEQQATLCAGTQLPLHASGALHYQWTPGADMAYADSSDPVALAQAPGLYVVKGSDEIGCAAYDTFALSVYPLTVVEATASENHVDCRHGVVQLHASGALTYSWQPAAYCSDPQGDAPTVNAPGSRLFVVTGTDQYGCKVSDSVFVEYAGSSIVKMPSAFSPNADQQNDVLKPIVICDFVQESFQVYNRWGSRIFESGSPDAAWDGTHKGIACAADTYFYVLKGRDGDGAPVVLKGNVTLVR